MKNGVRVSSLVWGAGLALALGGAAGAGAQPFDVAICAAAGSAGSCQFLDPQAKLLASGLFTRVDILNVGVATPTLQQLQKYDAVICWTNLTPVNTDAWGNVLADYVDAGGGVVVAVFANSTLTANRDIGGRWRNNPNYEVIVPRSGTTSGVTTTLGVVHDPQHPIMQGVATFSGGTSSFRPTVTNLNAGSVRIADWSDGRALVVVGANPARVDLGFYPPSSDCSGTWWVSTTDGAKLLANALAFAAAGGVPPCYPDCDTSTGVGVLDIFDFLCFQNRYDAGVPYACDCDLSTGPGVCDIFDFLCFQNAYDDGCP